jgi:hypothetical protein
MRLSSLRTGLKTSLYPSNWLIVASIWFCRPVRGLALYHGLLPKQTP